VRWWRRRSPRLEGLFEEAAGNAAATAGLLRDLVRAYPDSGDLCERIREREHQGDRLTQDIIHELHRRRRLRSVPADDGLALAKGLDDIVDFTDQAADTFGLHAVDAPMAQAEQLADVLAQAAVEVASAVAQLVEGVDYVPGLIAVHRLENRGDQLRRDGVAALFANGIDPMHVVRWKDIYEHIEQAVDACQAVANLLEGIAVARRRGSPPPVHLAPAEPPPAPGSRPAHTAANQAQGRADG
jgi:uncharacterized protein Yka (UPF0111/DUF47 family)